MPPPWGVRAFVVGAWLSGIDDLGAAAALAVLGATVAATGIGTGARPLGEGGGGTVGVSRSAPATLTAALSLRHSGWFDVHIESIRPIPRGDAAKGMPSGAVSMTVDPDAWELLLTDGTAEAEVPPAARLTVDGYVIPPSEPSPASGAVALTTFQIVADGEWRYDGCEVVYSHGWVRHRTQLGNQIVGCTTPIDTCGTSD